MCLVTLYPRIIATKGGTDIEMDGVLSQVQSGFYSAQVKAVREAKKSFGKDSKEYKNAKKESPYFTGSGTFDHRNESGLKAHSGFIIIDIDNLEDIDAAKAEICADKYTYACFVSIGGEGLAVVIRIDPNNHTAAFDAAERYYIQTFGIKIDYLADISRPRYVSWDPELFLNKAAVKFSPADHRERKQIRPTNTPEYWSDDNQIEFAKGIIEKSLNWQGGERHKYMFKLACFCNRLGVPESALDSWARLNFPHWAKNPSNAISWSYSHYRSEYGEWKREKKYSSGNGAANLNGHNGHNGHNGQAKTEERDEGPRIEDIIKQFEADLTRPVPEPEPVISIEGGTLSTAGNLTVITGASKTGKSGVMQGLMAGSICPPGALVDTIGLTIKANTKRKAVIHIDTEQSEFNHFRGFENTIARAGLTECPDHFHSLLFRTVSVRDLLLYTTMICDHYAEKHDGIFMIVIDGVGDYVTTVNDDIEGNAIIKQFEVLAMEFDCPLITVLHFNPNTEKERGHLGSQLQRKAESIMKVTKDPETEQSTIGYKELRNAGNLPEIDFEYNTVKGYHSFKKFVYKQNKAEEQRSALAELVNKAFAFQASYKHGDLVEWIKENEVVSESTALRRLRDMKKEQLILKDRNKLYVKA